MCYLFNVMYVASTAQEYLLLSILGFIPGYYIREKLPSDTI